MKPTALILLLALNAGAQFTITSTDPTGSHLWESENLTHWTRTATFSNAVEIPIGTERAKFFKTEARKGPVTLDVIDVKQTLRGRSNKPITNLVVTTEAGTFEGWTEFRSITPEGAEVFQWRFPILLNSTNATITATDCDGFITTTNVVIEQLPSDYTDPPKPGFKIQVPGFSAASTNDRMGDLWVTSHQVSQLFEVQQKAGLWKQSTSLGLANSDGASLAITYQEGRWGVPVTWNCTSTYTSTNNWAMTRRTATGGCYEPPFRWYAPVLEFASYNDTSTWSPSTVARERLMRTARTSVMVYVGDYPGTTNCAIRITYRWEKVVSRYGTEVTYEGMASPPAATVGCTGKAAGSFILCNNAQFLDVTPQIAVTGDALRFTVRCERF